jgi:outer membrane protein assembly factor BamB
MYVHTSDQLFIIDDEDFDLLLVGPFGIDEMEGGITDMAVTPDGTLYGITDSKLYTLNASNGAATYIADVPGVENVGLTFLTDGTLLATDAPGGVRQINPTTGLVNEVGTFGGGYATAGDLVAVADGTMFAISDEGPVGNEADNNVLLTVNTSTGVASPVGQIGFGGVFGCAVANNKVYAFTREGHVIEIDPTTGQGNSRRQHVGTAFWGAGVTPLATIE